MAEQRVRRLCEKVSNRGLVALSQKERAELEHVGQSLGIPTVPQYCHVVLETLADTFQIPLRKDRRVRVKLPIVDTRKPIPRRRRPSSSSSGSPTDPYETLRQEWSSLTEQVEAELRDNGLTERFYDLKRQQAMLENVLNRPCEARSRFNCDVPCAYECVDDDCACKLVDTRPESESESESETEDISTPPPPQQSLIKSVRNALTHAQRGTRGLPPCVERGNTFAECQPPCVLDEDDEDGECTLDTAYDKWYYDLVCNLLSDDPNLYKMDVVRIAKMYNIGPEDIRPDARRWRDLQKGEICRRLPEINDIFVQDLLDAPGTTAAKLEMLANEMNMRFDTLQEAMRLGQAAVSEGASTQSIYRTVRDYLSPFYPTFVVILVTLILVSGFVLPIVQGRPTDTRTTPTPMDRSDRATLDVLFEPNVSPSMAKRAFRTLALTHHPDRGGDPKLWRNIVARYSKVVGR